MRRRTRAGPAAREALSVHERDLFRSLWHLFEPRDVALADRGFCSFADI